MAQYDNRRRKASRWTSQSGIVRDRRGSHKSPVSDVDYRGGVGPSIWQRIQMIVFTLQVKFSGIDIVFNRKIEKTPREILMIRLWDIEMFGFILGQAPISFAGDNFASIYGVHFLGMKWIYSSNTDEKWIWDWDKKMIAVILTTAGFVLMNMWAGAFLPSFVVSIVPIWDVVSWPSLTLTSSLLSYRAYVACLEIMAGLENTIFSFMDRLEDKEDRWQTYCRNFLHYRIWLYAAIIPAVVLDFYVLTSVFTATVAISILDAVFSEESIFTFCCEPIGLCIRLCGYVRSIVLGFEGQFSIVSIDFKAFTPEMYSGTLAGKYSEEYLNHMEMNGFGCGIVETEALIEKIGLTLV